MRKQSGQVHSRESSATLQLTVSLLYLFESDILHILLADSILSTTNRFQKMKKLQFLKVGDYMKTITRAKYLDRIIELNGTPDIKIITGIRRSGKSKLMQAYIAYLESNFENCASHSRYFSDELDAQFF